MQNAYEMASLLFPHVTKTPDDCARDYPVRTLPEGARVTRFAPSPTGFLHIGGLFTALVNRRTADRGVCFLRIEDTDKKREVDDGVRLLIDGLARFGVRFDEGVTGPGVEAGAYGPYTQSARREIYQTYAKWLVEQDLAYPCFCTEEDLANLRGEQEAQKITPGYHGRWAKHRGVNCDEARSLIQEGKTYVLRLRSPGDPARRIAFDDAIKGRIEMPENDQDIVLLKSDGMPTYHLAHVIDDHLMGTTHVIRGDEWISSTPIHLQLFELLRFVTPVYAHVAPIMKEEGGGKRKLSKRKDPEAALDWYHAEGYPQRSVEEYLYHILDARFEDWRREYPGAPVTEFPFALDRMSASGALFDIQKLDDVSKNTISVMEAGDVFGQALDWAREHDAEFFARLDRDPAYATAIFAIDRGGPKPRKDLAKWSDVRDFVAYFYDELWDGVRELPGNIPPDLAARMLEAYRAAYNPDDDRDAWFAAVKDLCEPFGFAREVKTYKKNPGDYRGHVGDVAGLIRIAVTGRKNTPDLHAILRILGKERVDARIGDWCGELEGKE